MRKRVILMINILLLLIIGTLSYTSVMAQAQETQSKNNTMLISINSSLIKNALTSVHNDSIPQ